MLKTIMLTASHNNYNLQIIYLYILYIFEDIRFCSNIHNYYTHIHTDIYNIYIMKNITVVYKYNVDVIFSSGRIVIITLITVILN